MSDQETQTPHSIVPPLDGEVTVASDGAQAAGAGAVVQEVAEPVALGLSSLDLVAMLVRRICHDLASPIGAINNGLEVLEEEDDEEMRKIAMDLVQKTAKQASAKLRFTRLAVADSGGAEGMIDIGEAENVARAVIDGDKINLEWTAPRVLLPKNKVKLVLNLLSLAISAIPRGGRLVFEMTGTETAPQFRFFSKGSYARIPAQAVEYIAGTVPGAASDSHAVQYYYAGVLARASDMKVEISQDGDEVTVLVS